jgi:hypothetical protein
MSQFAALINTCVLRWRLPCYTAKGDNAELYAALSDSIVNSIPQLWGYYVHGRIDNFISQYGRVCNRSQVTLTSIVPSHRQALNKIFTDNNFLPGEVITIEAPIAVIMQCSEARDPHKNVFMLVNPSSSKGASNRPIKKLK